ncbi:methylglutaconyl-CoA hydratase [Limimaricola soesokkakensis]|uniref:Methylglutaconyl-CoA hydratase n=1 Tax=Limimaricola soesokkakensis TaxID=1343159 RepID=A0A1X6ZR23_9RHOB|nr:crotonase/enoyl-CoA hydratase family protein [Limimaricola soesokkakensis]PSK84101.1 methylglutaconyl-CoA hydratase [Limimaricola soesokkakensis]SLN59034.1 putative enoyl-CoA hydratase echA8 [Limimaricola soesokkakensis]
MSYETLKLDTDDRGVLTVTLNAPERRNALSARMMDELTALAGAEGAEARAVVLRGAGEVFCAGGDLTWMQAQIRADSEGRRAEARRLAGMLDALNTMSSPLIGRVHGGAYGGGVGLACICDVVVAEAGTRFGFTETKLGIIPATISPYVLARMGEGRARQVFMSARLFGADEAVRLGIATRAVPLADLDTAIEAEIAPYLKIARGAAARAKALARSLGPRIDEVVIEATIDRLVEAWESPEAEEGIAAFLEKRPARWS